MLFCPKCGSILRPREKAGKRILWCSCGFTAVPEEKKHDETKPEAKPKTEETREINIAKEIETNPRTKATCEKCGHKEAYYWTQQTRGADEPETRFFKCVKCHHIWREYS